MSLVCLPSQSPKRLYVRVNIQHRPADLDSDLAAIPRFLRSRVQRVWSLSNLKPSSGFPLVDTGDKDSGASAAQSDIFPTDDNQPEASAYVERARIAQATTSRNTVPAAEAIGFHRPSPPIAT